MEDVLDLYAEPYDPKRPTVCFDELPYQIVAETRVGLPVQPGRSQRVDYEYERRGTCNIFMAVQPQAGWRHVEVTDRRTAHDFAQQMKALVDQHFPEAEGIRLVVDNLNTHTPAALYAAFPAAEARRWASKLEFHYTPKHGSWLNMAEIELSVLGRQCLDRHFPGQDAVRSEAAAWERRRNAEQAVITWRFNTPDARIKLRRLYPSIS